MDYILKRPSSEPDHSRATLFLWSAVFPLTDHLDKRYIINVATSQSGRASSLRAPKHTGPAHCSTHWLLSEARSNILSSHWLERAPLVRSPLPCLTRDVRGLRSDSVCGSRRKQELSWSSSGLSWKMPLWPVRPNISNISRSSPPRRSPWSSFSISVSIDLPSVATSGGMVPELFFF